MVCVARQSSKGEVRDYTGSCNGSRGDLEQAWYCLTVGNFSRMAEDCGAGTLLLGAGIPELLSTGIVGDTCRVTGSGACVTVCV